MEPNIILKTNIMLDKNQQEDFLYTVEKYGPEGIIKGKIIEAKKYKNIFLYKIKLTRNLLKSETEFIVYAWDNIFSYNYDIEITYDEIYDLENNIDFVVNTDVENDIIKIASRFIHNRWVDQKISNGWRYGIYYSIKNKTDPKLRDWDSLPVEYRRNVNLNKKEIIDFYKNNKNLFT